MTGWSRNMQYDCSMSPVLIWPKLYPANMWWLFCGLWDDTSAASAQFLVDVYWTTNIISDTHTCLFHRKNRISLAGKHITSFKSRMMLTYYITKFISIRLTGKWKTTKTPDNKTITQLNLSLCKHGFWLLPKMFWANFINRDDQRFNASISWCFQHFRTSFSL